MIKFLLAIALGSYLLHLVNSLIVSGVLKTTKRDWILLGKFCFISEVGRVDYTISYPFEYGTLNLLFYYDIEWPNVYPKTELSCDAKEHQISTFRILNLTDTYNGCINDLSDPNNKMIRCTTSRRFIGARPRYWYMVISNCFPEAGYKGINIDYNFLFTNGIDVFKRQFSADEFGILETSIAMFILYFFVLIVVGVYAKILRKKHLLHSTFKLFMSTIVFEFIAMLFFMSEYAQFSSSGIFTKGMLTMARLFSEIGDALFLLMLVLLAKGFNVTRGKLRKNTWIKLIIVLTCYVVAIIIIFICAEVLFDEGVVNYFYNSGGGIALIAIRVIVGWLWFCYAIFFTIKNYPEKKKFYITLLIIFTIWFWATPLIIISASYLISEHVRQFIAFLVKSLIHFNGHFIFLILLRPTSENKTFPYHVKTNAVSLAADDPNLAVDYPHHKVDCGGNLNFIAEESTGESSNNIASMFQVDRRNRYEVEEPIDSSSPEPEE